MRWTLPLSALLASCATSSLPPVDRPVAANDPPARVIVDEELDTSARDPHVTSTLAVVLDARDGHVLAMQSLEHGVRDPELPARVLRSHGSIGKSFSLALALDHHVVATTDTFDGAPITLGTSQVSDHADHATMSLEDVFAFSSNVGAVHVYERLGRAPLLTGLDALGLGHRASPSTRTDDVAAARLAYGLELEATPVEIAAAIAALVNDGVHHAAWRDGEAPTTGTRVITSATSSTMRELFEAAVAREDATGHRGFVAGRRIGGKTGTVPHGDTSTHGAFVAIAPIDAPRFIVVVDVIADTREYSGGTLAAPVAARIADRLLAD